MSAEILSEGLRLSALGLAVHWLRPRTKIPVAGAYQRLPWLPPHVLRGMYREGFNVGLHTGNVMGARVPIVALDVDGEGAGEWVRRNIPKSPVVSKSAKGEHWLYRYPRGVEHIGNRVKVRVVRLDHILETPRIGVDGETGLQHKGQCPIQRTRSAWRRRQTCARVQCSASVFCALASVRFRPDRLFCTRCFF